MNWQCRLYGHEWRHPGAYEVVLTRENGPVHPFLCGRCGSEQLLEVERKRWLADLPEFEPGDVSPELDSSDIKTPDLDS